MRIYTTQPNTLAFNNVEYNVRVKVPTGRSWPFNKTTELKRVLNDVSGKLETGQMVAILGASGAGKTTLMAAVSQRIRGNQLKGELLFNGEYVNQEDMTYLSGFVPQYDSAIPVLTVKEHLQFMAILKLPSSVSKIQRTDRIDAIMKQLGIMKLSNYRIKNLSGGERRKLTLATELLREPLFLFCDEPTTGLDSFNTQSILETLRELVQNKPQSLYNQIKEVKSAEKSQIEAEFVFSKPTRGVICSIHQPSSEVFDYFTHIVLMYNGQIVFQGTKELARIFFQNLGFMCPSNYNPAEFYLNLITPAYFTCLKDFDHHIKEMKDAHDAIAYFESQNYDGVKIKPTNNSKRFNRAWLFQLIVLLKRSVIVTTRSYNESIWSSLGLLVIAIMIGVLYSNVNIKTQESIMSIRGAIFLVVIQTFFSQYKGVTNTFPPELPNIRREVGEKVYDLSAYYIMTVLIWIPRALIGAYFLFALVYYLSNFGLDYQVYIAMSFTIALTTILSQSYGYMWGCVFGQGLGIEISAPIDLFMMVFGGLYLNLDTLPNFKYFSVFYYPYEALSYQYWTMVNYIPCSSETILPCFNNGTEVLISNALHYEWYTIYLDYAGMIIISSLLLIVGFFGLKRFVNKEGFY